jgi:2-methylcitrate dehydratase PrpD
MIVYTPRGEDRITRADQHMSDLNLRYLLAATLLDGGLTFAAAHDDDRVHAPDIERIAGKISIRANPALSTPESPRQGVVEFATTDGRTLSDHVVKVRGAMENPMPTDEVVAKACELFETALARERTEELIGLVLNLEAVAEIGTLTRLLRPD